MAGLFKNKIIKEKLERFEVPDFEDKLKIVQAWRDASAKGDLQTKTESQCEQSFNSDFFIKVLGYTAFPNETYTIQPKDRVETRGGQIPDATLGHFTNSGKRVIAVVEIKDANTSLDKSQHREGNLSPVQQAFKYKPQFKECGFVIATNFVEIRLFRDNQLDYERFTLEDLVDPKDDHFQFRKFYYLLSAENFIREQGQTETEKLLSTIRIEQEKITDKFYKEYKKLREDLIKDIVANNKHIKRSDFYTHIVEKAQKLVDRIVLISFFEDAGLLPDGKLVEVVQYAQKGELEEPVWDTMKRFFKAIDEGSERLGIPHGYNGELFKNDEDLNNLKISDEVCNRFVDLGKFDFEEDLSVNILGHIFEQSITDLERLKSYANEKEFEAGEKDSKRKKEGIYYTPEYIVDYIVKNSVGSFLEEREREILKKHKVDSSRIRKDETYNKRLLQAYKEYQEVLQNIKVLDPACGSGAFLVRVFDFLLSENKRVSKVLAELQGNASLLDAEDYVKNLLQNNVYGVDLNPESVEITKLSLWLKSAQKGQKLVTLKGNIKCGDSLVSDPSVVGTRAFDWHEEFPEIMKEGGFDVVVGNPPYVLSRETLPNEIKTYFAREYVLQRDKPNLFLLFIERGLSLAKNNGYLGFIVPNSWLGIDSAYKIRERILSDYYLTNVLSLSGEAFKGVNLEASIFVVKKSQSSEQTNYRYLKSDFATFEHKQINQSEWLKNRNAIIDLVSETGEQNILSKIKEVSVPLEEVFDVRVGMQAYEKGKGSPSQTEEDVKNHVFDYDHKYDETTYRYLQGGDVGRYSVRWSGMWLRWGEWLSQPKTLNQFSGPRILIREITSKFPKALSAVYVEDVYLNNKSIINVLPKSEEVSLKYLLGVLNSSLISFWHIRRAVKGNRTLFPKVVIADVNAYPIVKADQKLQDAISAKVDQVLQLTADFYEKLNKQNELLREELGLKAMPKKLAQYYRLSFDEFVSLAGKNLKMERKSELLDFYNNHSGDLVTLESKLSNLNAEIDSLVLDAYGLNEEEKQVVLQGGEVD